MATPTFAPPFAPNTDSSAPNKPRINKAQFGDGYGQRTRDGLNARQDKATWHWTGLTVAQYDAMDAFFGGLGGADPFWWTPPDEDEPKKFICEEWSKGFPAGNLRSLVATFEQVFDPGD
jgi:phage-related protein